MVAILESKKVANFGLLFLTTYKGTIRLNHVLLLQDKAKLLKCYVLEKKKNNILPFLNKTFISCKLYNHQSDSIKKNIPKSSMSSYFRDVEEKLTREEDERRRDNLER